jgi:two-component system, sensor histidine kinase YesM
MLQSTKKLVHVAVIFSEGGSSMRNPIKTYRLDHIFFSSFAILIMALTLIITWIAYSVSSQELLKTTSHYQQGLLFELNRELTIQLNAIEQLSLSTSRNIDFLEYLSLNDDDEYTRYKKFNDILQYLTNITNSTSSIHSMNLYVHHPIASDRQRSVQFIDYRKLPSEPWYSAVQNTDFTWIGEHNITTFQGEVPVISFARKIYSNTNEYKGLILVNIKASAIRSLLQSDTQPVNRMLLDSGGHPLVKIGHISLDNGIQDEIRTMKDGSGNLQIDTGDPDGHSLLVWSKRFNSNWILIEITPRQQVTSGSVKLSRILLLLGLTTVLIALGLSLLISSRLMKPIRILAQAMGKYTLGSSKVELPSDYHNEFGYLFSGYRRQMERIDELYRSLKVQHRRQREAEVKALQANINPHFLYNTLDQINWMALEAGQPEISNTLELVGKMFRIGLSNGDSMIRLEEELSHIECYLQIQQIHWGEGLDFELRISEELIHCFVPKITLQPFVENAVMHGLHGRSEGKIVIAAIQEESGILLTVEDDGNGLCPSWKEAKQRKTGGYGIRNVRERVDALFGSPYGIKVENRMNGSGTIVSIHLPLLHSQRSFESA